MDNEKDTSRTQRTRAKGTTAVVRTMPSRFLLYTDARGPLAAPYSLQPEHIPLLPTEFHLFSVQTSSFFLREIN
jgi:hypothetical protein